MNIRRRTPNVFNLSMVDILCCALGCVILLWLVNSRDAKRRSAEAKQISDQLAATQRLLDSSESRFAKSQHTVSQLREEKSGLESDIVKLRSKYTLILGGLEKRLEKKKKDLETLARHMEIAGKNLALLQKSLRIKDKEITALSGQKKNLNAELLRFNKLFAELQKKLIASDAKAKDLSGLLALSEKQVQKLAADLKLSNRESKNLLAELAKSAKEKKSLSGKLTSSAKLVKQLRDLVAALQVENKNKSKELTSTKISALAMEKKLNQSQIDLDDLTKRLASLLKEKKSLQQLLTLSKRNASAAAVTISGLKADKKKLLQQKNLLYAAFANRFAGINLTGKKVIFLVDVSGSMSMLDTETLAPDKWPEVCATIGKIVRSLPNLSHYQVIAFSETVSYPLGGKGRWIVYDPQTSPKFLVDSLKKIQPKGGTKMRPAFEEAFGKYAGQGLDTIYLVSDGLPNDDDNLPLNMAKELAKLKGVQRTAWLSQLVRRQLRTEWNRPVGGRAPVRIHSVGYFFESPEVGAFLWALSRENSGSFVGMSRP